MIELPPLQPKLQLVSLLAKQSPPSVSYLPPPSFSCPYTLLQQLVSAFADQSSLSLSPVTSLSLDCAPAAGLFLCRSKTILALAYSQMLCHFLLDSNPAYQTFRQEITLASLLFVRHFPNKRHVPGPEGQGKFS
jgi:hypothetical protein